MKIENEIDALGIFWESDNPEVTYPGHLKIVDGGKSKLKLFNFVEYQEDAASQSLWERANDLTYKLTSLEGILEGHGLVILVNNAIAKNTLSGYGFYTLLVFPHSILFQRGTDVSAINLWDNFAIHIQYVENWIGNDGFSHQKGESPFSVTYYKPESYEFKINNETRMEIHPMTTLKYLNFPYSFSLLQNQTFLFKYSNGISTENIISRCHDFTCLIRFFMGFPVVLSPIKLSQNNYLQSAELVFQSLFGPSNEMKINSRSFFVPFEVVKPKFERILQIWFQKSDLLARSTDLYFAYKNSPSYYVENNYLTLTQALEAIAKYMRYSNISSFPRSTYKKYDGLTQSGDKRGHTFHRLAFLFEPYLEYIKMDDEFENHIDFIVFTRNYLTHSERKQSQQTAEGRGLSKLIADLEKIYKYILLECLGFTKEEIIAVINGTLER